MMGITNCCGLTSPLTALLLKVDSTNLRLHSPPSRCKYKVEVVLQMFVLWNECLDGYGPYLLYYDNRDTKHYIFLKYIKLVKQGLHLFQLLTVALSAALYLLNLSNK